jgi:hypothetical protein
MKRLLLALFAVAMVLSFAGCGNPRPPEPPALELPKTVRDLRATRKGNTVKLSWTVPTKTTEAQTIRYLGPTRICRGIDSAMLGSAMLGSAMKECGVPAGEAPPPDLSLLLGTNSQNKSQSATYVDTLPSAQLSPTGKVIYAVEVLNQNQRSAGLSNQVTIPAAPTLPAPANFRAELSANGVTLSWDTITPDPDTADLQHLYRISRQEKDGRDVVIANLAISTSQFLDHTFDWEKTYDYRVEVVTIVKASTTSNCSSDQNPSAECGAQASVDGDDSSPIEIFAHDIFPPSVPSGLQAVYTDEGQQKFIDLIWSPNSEADLAGYNVFRHEEGAVPTQINLQLVKTPAYRDTNVQPGEKYFYSVSAVDVRNNQSERSQEASESAP